MKKELKKSFLALMNKKQKRNEDEINFLMMNEGDKVNHGFVCDKFIYQQESGNPEKYFIFERLVRKSIVQEGYDEKLKKRDVEYRIVHYILSRIPKSKNTIKWVFIDSSPLIPHKEFEKLIAKAKKKGLYF